VGESVFVKETGSVVAQLLTYPSSVEGYSPELLGRKREVVLSKKSGKKSVEYILQELGIAFPPEKIDALLGEVKKLGIKKKGLVNRQEFKQLAENLV
jgi:isopropylmalate/homocitrate/citramalate synthase